MITGHKKVRNPLKPIHSSTPSWLHVLSPPIISHVISRRLWHHQWPCELRWIWRYQLSVRLGFPYLYFLVSHTISFSFPCLSPSFCSSLTFTLLNFPSPQGQCGREFRNFSSPRLLMTSPQVNDITNWWRYRLIFKSGRSYFLYCFLKFLSVWSPSPSDLLFLHTTGNLYEGRPTRTVILSALRITSRKLSPTPLPLSCFFKSDLCQPKRKNRWRNK